jgi:hypothetical protein
LEYEYREVDNNGNETTYNLVQKIDNKLNPKESITREDFLYMAYVTFKSSACINVETKYI